MPAGLVATFWTSDGMLEASFATYRRRGARGGFWAFATAGQGRASLHSRGSSDGHSSKRSASFASQNSRSCSIHDRSLAKFNLSSSPSLPRACVTRSVTTPRRRGTFHRAHSRVHFLKRREDALCSPFPTRSRHIASKRAQKRFSSSRNSARNSDPLHPEGLCADAPSRASASMVLDPPERRGYNASRREAESCPPNRTKCHELRNSRRFPLYV